MFFRYKLNVKTADTPAIPERTHQAINSHKPQVLRWTFYRKPVYDALSHPGDVSLTDTGVFQVERFSTSTGSLFSQKIYLRDDGENLQVHFSMQDCLLTHNTRKVAWAPLDTLFTLLLENNLTLLERVVDHLANLI